MSEPTGGTDAGSVYVTLEAEGTAAFERELDRKLKIIANKLGGQFAKRFSDSYGRYLLRSLPVQTRRAVIAAQRAAGRITIPVDVDAAAARAELAALSRNRDVTINVRVDDAGARARLNQLGASAGTAGRRARWLALALASIGPIAIPAISATIAAVVSLGTVVASAGIAVGVAALAFSGIGDAVKALGKESGSTAAQVAGVGRSAVQAAQRAYALKQATQAIADAERSLADAQRRTKTAQLGLNDARKEALKNLQDLKAAASEGALSEKEAETALARAEDNLRRVGIDPRAGVLDQREAQDAVERAKKDLADQKKANKDNGKALADAQKKGIDGSKVVLDAIERIREARRDEADAARQVARAIEAQKIAQLQEKTAVEATIPAVKALNDAMDKLSPAGRRFARYLFSLRPELRKLKAEAESGLFPGLERALENLRPFLPALGRFIGDVARAMGDVAVDWSKSLGSRDSTRFFTYLAEVVPRTIREMGGQLKSLAGIFANLFVGAGPAGEGLFTGFGDFLDRLEKWTGSKKGQTALKDFFADAIPTIKSILKFLGSIINLGGALSGGGGLTSFLDGLTNFFNASAEWIRSHPGKVESLLWGILAAMVAMKALKFTSGVFSGLFFLVGLIPGLGTIGGILRTITTYFRLMALAFGIGAGTLLLITGLIIGIAVALVYAYKKFPWFKRVVDTTIHAIGAFFKWLWEKAVWPALKAIGNAFKWLYQKFVKPYMKLVKVAIDVAWAGAQIAFGLFRIGIKLLGKVFRWLYDSVVRPVWRKIKPVLQALGDYIGDKVEPAFKTGVKAIGAAWKMLEGMVKKPVEFIVNTVINKGIIGPYNKLAKLFDVNQVDTIKLPWSTKSPSAGLDDSKRSHGYADGGVLPGNTPGRDVHHFASPTGGRLSLSGGEAIMRPEWTKAVGGRGAVAAMNAAARTGRFALGGIWDGAKKKAGGVLRNLGSKAKLLANPGEAIEQIVEGMLNAMPGKDSGLAKILASMAKKTAKSAISSVLGFFGAPGGAGAGVSSGMGWEKQMQVLRAVFPGLPLNSGYRPGARTATGNPSMHGAGRAVDVPPRMDVFNWIKANYPNSKELIFSPAGARQLYNGAPHVYGEPTKSMHYNHVHWGYDNGGLLKPGTRITHNGTGKPEKVLTDTQWADISKIAGVTGGAGTVDRSIHLTSDYHNVARDIARIQRREELKDRLLPNR